MQEDRWWCVETGCFDAPLGDFLRLVHDRFLFAPVRAKDWCTVFMPASIPLFSVAPREVFVNDR